MNPDHERAAFAGRTVLVAGTGIAGRSAIRALLELDAHVLVSSADPPANLPAGAVFLGDLTAVPAGVDLVFTSPGLPPVHPLLVAAQRAGIEVIGELEFAWRIRGPEPAQWLLVTGTNGKTTTVRMLEAILRAAGQRCLAVGNVGVSIIDAVLADRYGADDPPPVGGAGFDVLAVEASSFQLQFCTTVRARAGAVLNLAEDHLDWHGSMAGYAAQQAKVWRSEVAIANADDAALQVLFCAVGEASSGPRLITFTGGGPRPGQLGVRGGMLVDRAFADAQRLFAAADIRPPGAHNVLNALAAIALARTAGADESAIEVGLRSFVPDPHRNQFIVGVGGVDYIDDSKATNPHAAAASLGAYPRVVWIAGGQLKGADIEPVVRQFCDRLVGAVLLGADRELVRRALARHAPDLPVISVPRTDDGAMMEVVRAAASLARPGDAVLLAPAAASKDMYSGYQARGQAFAAAARSLAAQESDGAQESARGKTA